jgi:hypothetical protein
LFTAFTKLIISQFIQDRTSASRENFPFPVIMMVYQRRNVMHQFTLEESTASESDTDLSEKLSHEFRESVANVMSNCQDDQSNEKGHYRNRRRTDDCRHNAGIIAVWVSSPMRKSFERF